MQLSKLTDQGSLEYDARVAFTKGKIAGYVLRMRNMEAEWISTQQSISQIGSDSERDRARTRLATLHVEYATARRDLRECIQQLIKLSTTGVAG